MSCFYYLVIKRKILLRQLNISTDIYDNKFVEIKINYAYYCKYLQRYRFIYYPNIFNDIKNISSLFLHSNCTNSFGSRCTASNVY